MASYFFYTRKIYTSYNEEGIVKITDEPNRVLGPNEDTASSTPQPAA